MVLTAAFTHELGHWAVARLYGKSITFRFVCKPVPRGLWDMPADLPNDAKAIIGLSGFGLEMLLAALTMYFPYMLIVAVHLFLYNIYAGEASDFKWLNY
jgi:hypothetical protein